MHDIQLRTFDLQQQRMHDFEIKDMHMADGSDVYLRLFDVDEDDPSSTVYLRRRYEGVDGAFVVFDCSQQNEFKTHVRCGNIECNVHRIW